MKPSLALRKQMQALVAARVKRSFSDFTECGKAWGCSRQMVQSVVAGKRMPTNQILKLAGVEVVARLKALDPANDINTLTQAAFEAGRQAGACEVRAALAESIKGSKGGTL